MMKFALPVVAAFFSIALMATTTPVSAAGALSQTRHIQSGLAADSLEPVHYRKRRFRRHGYYGGPFFSFQFGNHYGYNRHYYKRRHYKRRHYKRRHYRSRYYNGRKYKRRHYKRRHYSRRHRHSDYYYRGRRGYNSDYNTRRGSQR